MSSQNVSARAESKCPRREYLVFWKGKPSVQGFADRSFRSDALARVIRGALRRSIPAKVHFMFQDCSLLSLDTDFRDVWYCSSPSELSGTDSGLPDDVDLSLTAPGSQERLVQLLTVLAHWIQLEYKSHGRHWNSNLGKQMTFRGVVYCPPLLRLSLQNGGRRCIEQVLGVLSTGEFLQAAPSEPDAAAATPARFAAVLELTESGCPLHFDSVVASRACGANAISVVGYSLVVLGGVRDMEDWEKELIVDVCADHKVPHHQLSLGRHSELTSKCIKALEAADDVGFLHPALSRCRASKWLPAGDQTGAIMDRPPLHVVVLTSTPLTRFLQEPEAANLFVDCFLGSRKAYRHTALTIMDTQKSAVQFKDSGLALDESEALERFRRDISRAHTTTVAQVVSTWVRSLAGNQYGGPRAASPSPVILHADEECGRRPLPPAPPRPGSTNVPAMVVFAPSSMAVDIRRAGAQAGIDQKVYARCAVAGGYRSGVAFCGMLHGEGLLAPMIRATAQLPATVPVPRPPVPRPSGNAAATAAGAPARPRAWRAADAPDEESQGSLTLAQRLRAKSEAESNVFSEAPLPAGSPSPPEASAVRGLVVAAVSDLEGVVKERKDIDEQMTEAGSETDSAHMSASTASQGVSSAPGDSAAGPATASQADLDSDELPAQDLNKQARLADAVLPVGNELDEEPGPPMHELGAHATSAVGSRKSTDESTATGTSEAAECVEVSNLASPPGPASAAAPKRLLWGDLALDDSSDDEGPARLQTFSSHQASRFRTRSDSQSSDLTNSSRPSREMATRRRATSDESSYSNARSEARSSRQPSWSSVVSSGISRSRLNSQESDSVSKATSEDTRFLTAARAGEVEHDSEARAAPSSTGASAVRRLRWGDLAADDSDDDDYALFPLATSQKES